MKPPSSFKSPKETKKSKSSSITTREQNTGFTQLYRSLSSKTVKRMTAPYKSIQTEARMKRGRRRECHIYYWQAHYEPTVRLNKRCTNNQSEQVAILKSLEYIQNINTAGNKVTIYTDSQTTLDSIKTPESTHLS